MQEIRNSQCLDSRIYKAAYCITPHSVWSIALLDCLHNDESNHQHFDRVCGIPMVYYMKENLLADALVSNVDHNRRR